MNKAFLDLTTDALGRPVFRYIIIGGFSFIVEIAVMYSTLALGWGAVTSVAVSFWVGLVVSFLLQKFIVFRDLRSNRKLLFWQSACYVLLVLFNYIFTLIAVWLLVPVVSVYLIRVLVIIATTSWNFIIYKKIIFR